MTVGLCIFYSFRGTSIRLEGKLHYTETVTRWQPKYRFLNICWLAESPMSPFPTAYHRAETFYHSFHIITIPTSRTKSTMLNKFLFIVFSSLHRVQRVPVISIMTKKQSSKYSHIATANMAIHLKRWLQKHCHDLPHSRYTNFQMPQEIYLKFPHSFYKFHRNTSWV